MNIPMQDQTFSEDELEEFFGLEDEKFDPHTYITSDGVKIRTKKVSPFYIERIWNSIEEPPKPTYSVTTVTGETQEFEHTPDSIETEEEKEAWTKYEQELRKVQADVNEKLLNFIFLKVVDVELPEDDSWMEDQEFLGIKVPKEDRRELKIHYVKTEVISSVDDTQGLLVHAMKSIGIRREIVEKVEDSFPGGVQGQEPEGTKPGPETGRRVLVRRRVDVQ